VQVQFVHALLAMHNSAAICLLALPSAMSCNTSASREVSWSARYPTVRPQQKYGVIIYMSHQQAKALLAGFQCLGAAFGLSPTGVLG
jgi:hypothetical protein